MLSKSLGLLLPSGLAAPTLVAAGCRLASTGLSIALLAVLTRSLGPEEYGRFVVLLSIGTMLGQVLPLGQQALLLKHYRPNSPPEQNWALLRTNSAWLAAGTGLIVLTAATLSPANVMPGLPAALIFAAIFALTEYFLNFFRVHGRMAWALVPRENAWRLLVLCTIPAWAWQETSPAGHHAFLLATGLLFLPVAVQVAKFIRTEGLAWIRAKNPVPARWRRESGYFFGANVLFASANYLDTIVIGAVIGLQEAAIYFTAFRISKLLEMPKLILNTAIIPRLAAACQTADRPAIQRILRQMVVFALAPTVIAGLLTIMLCRSLLGVFDPSFAGHAHILVILVFVTGTVVGLGEGEPTMKMAGGEKQQLIAYSLLLLVHLFLLTVLGNLLGLTGVTVAYGLHVTARAWFARHWCRTNLTVDPAITSARPHIERWLTSRPKGFA